MKKFFIIGAFALIIFIVFLGVNSRVGLISSQNSKTHFIVLTEDGFTPDMISIQQGDTITFKTTTGKPFWPASNLHPTHEIYSAFDPKDPVDSDKSWSFTFNKIGKWEFHDHLAPYYTGSITVVD